LGITNKITLPERYTTYTIEISKQGYKTYRDTFTKEELRLYNRSEDKGPFVVILDKEDIPKEVVDVDGNVYHTITIGTQVWLLENLKTKHYRNGDAIPNVTDGYTWQYLTSGAYCNYGNNESNSTIYGLLYNGYAVSDSRNICPIGWHIPSEAELLTLVNYLGGVDVAGGKLKATTSHWYTPNVGANNSSGFTALPGGYRRTILPGEYEYGKFSNLTWTAYFWTSENVDVNNALSFYLHYTFKEIKIGPNDKLSGYSVRCIKD
jgi:uncharacterized protein (TIGR02145 family)